MNTVDISKATKKALIPIFGKEHVRVNRGRGTASSWIHRYVQIPRPADCYCEQLSSEEKSRCMGFHQCEPCRETKETARRVIGKACESIRYGYFYQDDGYGTETDCTLTDVTFDNEYSWHFGTKES